VYSTVKCGKKKKKLGFNSVVECMLSKTLGSIPCTSKKRGREEGGRQREKEREEMSVQCLCLFIHAKIFLGSYMATSGCLHVAWHRYGLLDSVPRLVRRKEVAVGCGYFGSTAIHSSSSLPRPPQFLPHTLEEKTFEPQNLDSSPTFSITNLGPCFPYGT
jgi:hypothetical protein